MRGFSLILGLLASALSACAGSAEQERDSVRHLGKPMRVMSMNQCTDQIVLALLPPERIASVSWLARNPDGSVMYEAAFRVPINHGLSEEVVRQDPDLVIAGTFTTPATRGLLKRLGYPLIEVQFPESFEDIRRTTRQIAKAVGEEARGEAMIARMDHQLADLALDSGPPLRVAAWDGAGFNAREGSLYDNVLKAAGAINVVNRPPAITYGNPDTEVLLQSAPTLLVKGEGIGRKPGLRDNVERHPVIRRFWDGPRTLTVQQAYYVCGTPLIADAAIRLRAELREAAAKARTPLPFAPTRAM